ncbi:MAG: hypothetical protein KDE22_06060 [Rhodobacterales bacterium]|nr:hypothetical protein [Rhodobacterales bacterium]
MKRKSVSNAIAGGLLSGATVMGVQPAHAVPTVHTQTREATFNFAGNALTCCYDLGTNQQQFVFDGFDPALGTLNTADLGITLEGLVFDSALTCCYDINDVVSFSGHIGGVDLNDSIVRDLADGMAKVVLDINNIGVDLNTATLDFSILFGDGSVLPVGDAKATIAYSYTFEPAPVPAPGVAALLAPGLLAPLAARALRRRRRKDDETLGA